MRDDFSCGEEELDNYLATLARKHDERGTTRVLVACEQDQNIVRGFYAVSSTSVPLEDFTEAARRGLPDPVPAALLGRLAVDERYQGHGLGRYLIVDALRRVDRVHELMASYCVVVDAMTERAGQMYARLGFERFRDENPLRLWLPTTTIRGLTGQR